MKHTSQLASRRKAYLQQKPVGTYVQIGVAGRTGCGKSTLMMALFRIVEPCGGRILIDGLDVSRMGLTDLRSRLALVPQVSPPTRSTLRV